MYKTYSLTDDGRKQHEILDALLRKSLNLYFENITIVLLLYELNRKMPSHRRRKLSEGR